MILNPSSLQKTSSLTRWVAAAGIASACAFILSLGVAQAQMSGPTGGTHPEHAKHSESRKHAHGEHHLKKMLDSVKATPEQREKVTSIAKQSQEKSAQDRQSMQATMKANREAMQAAMSGPNVDRAAIERLRAERVAAMERKSRQRTDTMLSIAEVLTPEQRQQLAKDFSKMREQRGHRMQRG